MPDSIRDYKKLTEAPWGLMFYDIIYKQLNLPTDKRLDMLDFGAGFCITAEHYASCHNVTAIEPNSEMIGLRSDKNHCKLLCGGAELLKEINSSSFDVVICHNVLEYTENKDEIIEELIRVLKPCGTLSVVKHNLKGRILSEAILNDNPKGALSLLNNNIDNNKNMFGVRSSYDNEYLTETAARYGAACDNIFGIRCFFGLSSNSKIKYNDEWYNTMLELETAVCDIPEYRNIAFYNHLIFTKNKERKNEQ